MAKQVERDDPHRAVTPALTGEAAHIFAFLEDHFRLAPRDTEPGKPKTATDEMPERVVLRAVFGRGGTDLGPEIHAETWKPSVSPLPTRERLAELSNKFLGLAQRDCAALDRKQHYALFVYSNIKGPSAYGRHLFRLAPGAREYTDADGPASDDEDSHSDRLLATALAHSRWQTEQFSTAIEGVMRLQQDIIVQQQQRLTQMEMDRRQWIVATEEALSKKQEREAAAAWAATKNKLAMEGIGVLKSLAPAVGVYLAKGAPSAIAGGLRSFLDGLDDATRVGLLGRWEAGRLIDPGLLDEDQARLVEAIVDGRTDAGRVGELLSSLRAEQLAGAQALLSPPQLAQLIALGRAAVDTANGSGQ